MPLELAFCTDVAPLQGTDSLHIVGSRQALERPSTRTYVPSEALVHWEALTSGDPGDTGRTATTLIADPPQRIVVGTLPLVPSRHNSPMSAHAWPNLVSAGRGRNAGVIALVDDPSHARAIASAIARTLPMYSGRSTNGDGRVTVLVVGPDGPIADPGLAIVAEAVRRACWMVDTPPNQFGPDAFVSTARRVAQHDGVTATVLRRRQLLDQGMGGIYAVGQASRQEPALVALDWAPADAKRAVCWVGKGITYDTGGLSLKTKTGMPGMKTDLGGAAAVLAAFEAVVRLQLPIRLTAVLCIAENAIGPDALRPDDVIRMYSGRTVEINNTDAEGRLVLADGVAWAVKHREPQALIDIATLTGAQSTSTGKVHAALYCNDDELEALAVRSGKRSGDVVHPLPYAPELFRREFASGVADMRNSVKDRSNAQASCAGQFIGNHLGAYSGPWLHIDIAGPSRAPGNRGSGFGVALLLDMLEDI